MEVLKRQSLTLFDIDKFSEIYDGVIQLIFDNKDLTKLRIGNAEYIDIANSIIESRYIKTFSRKLSKNNSLTMLDLSRTYNKLAGGSDINEISVLSAISNIMTLTVLNLDNCKINSKGMKALVGILDSNRQLVKLSLSII